MKYFLIFFIFFTFNFSYAEILLVANKNTSLSDYKTICEKNNYLCFPKGLLNVLPKKTLYFDRLIENFDLDDKAYVASFSKELASSLKEDDLTLDHIKNLILAAEKLKLYEKVTRLKNIHSILSSYKSESSDKILIVAGLTIPDTLQNRMRLDPYLNEIKHIKADYVSYTENEDKKFYLNGDCDYPRYTEFISQLDIQVIPHFSAGCSMTQKYNWGSDLIADHLKEHKNKYLFGLAAAATIFFLKNYEVSIEK